MHRWAETLKSFQASCTSVWKIRTRYWTLMPVETLLEKGRKSSGQIFFKLMKRSFNSSNKLQHTAFPLEVPNCWIKEKRLLTSLGFQTFQWAKNGWIAGSYLPFTKTPNSSLFPIIGISYNNTPAITTLTHCCLQLLWSESIHAKLLR